MDKCNSSIILWFLFLDVMISCYNLLLACGKEIAHTSGWLNCLS